MLSKATSTFHQQEFPQRLKEALSQPLPGPLAQQAMSSVHRLKTGWAPPPENARVSAVLLALSHDGERVRLPFIRRAIDHSVHSGQIALPGGRKEEQDASLVSTALRETYEEIGIAVSENQVLGQLTPLYIPPSNSLVTPVVAWLPEPPEGYQPDPREVDAVLEFSLEELLHPPHRKETEVTVMGNLKMKAPAFVIEDTVIWGATAMMMNEFLEVWQQL